MALNSPDSHVTLDRPEIAPSGPVSVTSPPCVEALSCSVALPGIASVPANNGAGHRSQSALPGKRLPTTAALMVRGDP